MGSPALIVFKVDAIDGKKWVKFVAMQQDRATLIYDLNTIKGTAESYLKKIAQPFKTRNSYSRAKLNLIRRDFSTAFETGLTCSSKH